MGLGDGFGDEQNALAGQVAWRPQVGICRNNIRIIVHRRLTKIKGGLRPLLPSLTGIYKNRISDSLDSRMDLQVAIIDETADRVDHRAAFFKRGVDLDLVDVRAG